MKNTIKKKNNNPTTPAATAAATAAAAAPPKAPEAREAKSHQPQGPAQRRFADDRKEEGRKKNKEGRKDTTTQDNTGRTKKQGVSECGGGQAKEARLD